MDKNPLPEDITLENIHTLSGDTIELIEKEKITQAKLIAKREQEDERIRQDHVYQQEQTKSGRTYRVRNILLMLAGTVALIGIALTVLNFVNKESQEVPIIPTQTEKTLVSFDSKKEIIFSLAEIRNPNDVKIKLISEGSVVSGGVTYFKTDPSLPELITLLSPQVPSEFLRTVTDTFWGGYPAGNFLIIKVDSRDRAYASMLEWERVLGADLASLFGSAPASIGSFTDKVVENKDTRIVFDAQNKPIFLYGFYNENVIVVAKNEEVFKSVFDGLLRQNL